MPPIWNDVASLLPQSWVPASPLPTLASHIPPSPLSISAHPTVVAFVRHCGCPFAQNEVNQLARLSSENQELRVIVVCMSEEEDAIAWFARIGGNEFKDTSRVTLVADPTRAIYAAWGLGSLSYSALFSYPMVTALLKLKKEGTVNTETVKGSNRWQNSGGFAVKDGKIEWVKVAEHAGDMCDYESGVASLKL